MADRRSALIYMDSRTPVESSQSFDGEALFTSPHGVPILWIFAFGGRNIWNPGDSVVERGGAVGNRNPYETSVEVAVLRLEHAESALSTSAPYVWPWLSAMPTLRRKLMTKSRNGYIRVAAPWLVSLKDKDFERWRAATAFVENSVHYIVSNQQMHANESLKQLDPFCPFVPWGNPKDLHTFRRLKAYPSEEEAMRVALLTLGEPQNRGPFETAVRRDVTKALEEYQTMVSEGRVLSTSSSAVPKLSGLGAAAPSAARGGLFARMKGLLRRK